MPALSDDIGAVFEEIVQARFPDFLRADLSGTGILPDFETRDFFVEAKTGFWDFGVQIKDYQVDSFHKNGKPVVYLLGYHDFSNSRERLGHLSSPRRRAILRRHMGIESAFFVTDRIVRAIWRREHLVSEKEGRVYCAIKKRFLRNIMENAQITRREVSYRTRDWFGLEKAKLVVQPAQENQYGLVLDAKTDQPVIGYLSSRRLIR